MSDYGDAGIDDRLPTPLYHQIYLVIRDRILSGDFAYDSVLPGEQDLGKQFGVSRITVKRALSELASEGYISRHRGRGTVVKFRMPSPQVKANLEGLLENLLMMGLKTEVELLEFRVVPADRQIAEALGLEEGADVQYAVRLRSLEGQPFSYLVTHIPMDVAKGIKRQDLTRTPLLALLERGGIVVTSARQTITATAASPAIAQRLGVAIGAPLMKITRVVRDQNERPIQHIVAIYRPDRYAYDMTLTRVASEGKNIWNTN